MAVDRRRRHREGYSLELLGSKSDIDFLAELLEGNGVGVANKGPRYHFQNVPEQGWHLDAHEIHEDIVRGIKAKLFELAMRSSVTRFILTHERCGTFHLHPDFFEFFESFLGNRGRPKSERIIFMRNEDVLAGCSECLESSKELASYVLSIKTPRIAILLLYYALEELGKAAILFNSAVRSRVKNPSVAHVEGFYNHRCKLKEASYELLGIEVRVGQYGHERKGGAVEKLISETEWAVIWDEQHLGDLWALKETAVVEMFHVLLDYGAIFRDDSLYVDYDSRERKWRKPAMRWDESTCDKAARVLIMLLDRLIRQLRKLSSFPSDAERLNDLIRPFADSFS
jgi:hypothetical protein